jgi:hypothetical protein
LMIRGDPSTLNETGYIDGSVQGKQSFSIYARSANPSTAIAGLDAIKNALWLCDFSITDAQNITIKITTTPAFVSKETSGESVYYITGIVEYYAMGD